MTAFSQQLLDATAPRQRALFEIPFVAAAVEGRLSLDAYVAFLEQAYHHVSHTVPLLEAAQRAFPNRLSWLADEFDRYIEEESGHDEWVLDDIRACGGDPEVVRQGEPGPACRAMVRHAYERIEAGVPIDFLGMVHVLEGTSVRGATRAAEMLQRNLGLPTHAFTYLTTHGDVDTDHVDFFASLVDRLDVESDRRAVLAASDRFFTLYGDVFRELGSHLAEPQETLR